MADDDYRPRVRPFTRRQFMILTGAAAVAGPLLPGCGGGGGGDNGVDIPADGDFFTARDVIVKPNVRVLPEDGSLAINDVTTDGLTLSGAVPPVQPGDVVVSGLGAGLLRKVIGVTPVGTTVAVQTQDGTFTDVFESADVQFRQGLDFADVQDNGGLQIATRGRAEEGLRIFIPPTSISAKEDDTKIGLQLSANCLLNADVSSSLLIRPGEGLRRFEIATRATFDGEYSMKVTADFPAFTPKVHVHGRPIVFKPIRIGAVGPVPIILVNILFIQSTLKGKLVGGWESKARGSANYLASMLLDGGASAENLDFLSSGTATGDFTLSNFFASFDLEAVPLQLELQSTIDFLFGPKFLIDLPAVKAKAQANLGPTPVSGENSVDLSIDLVPRATVNAKAGMLGLALPESSVTLAEFPFNVFKKNFKPGAGSVGLR